MTAQPHPQPATPTSTQTAAPLAALPAIHKSEHAERALLGRLLVLGAAGKAQAAYDMVSDLKVSDFGLRRHQLIWHAIREISARNDKLSLVMVETELNKTLKNSTAKAIDEVTPSYLHGLMDQRSADVLEAKKIIQRYAWRRKGKPVAREIEKLLDDDTQPEDRVMNAIVAHIETLNAQAAALFGRKNVTLYDSVESVWQRIEANIAAHQAGEVTGYGILMGLDAVDSVTQGFQRGKVYVCAGLPGTGKSAFAILAALNGMKQGARVCFVPLEMTSEQMTTRLIAIESGIGGTALSTGNVRKEDLSRLYETRQRIQGYEEAQKFHYLEFESRPNVKQLRANFHKHFALYGCDILIVDQVSIEAMSGTRAMMDEKEVVREIITELKDIAKEYNIPVLVMAQLSRAGDVAEGQRPRLSHLASSSSMEKTVDVAMLLYREKGKEQRAIEPMEINFAKHREGFEGVKHVSYMPYLTKIVDVGVQS